MLMAADRQCMPWEGALGLQAAPNLGAIGLWKVQESGG